jgi:hypothetical protein
MAKNFAIFTYELNPAPIQGDIFDENPKQVSDSSTEGLRKRFEFLFGDKNNVLNLQKYDRADSDVFPCTVMYHENNIVLLRIEKPKNLNYWEKTESPTGEAATIEKKRLTSSPFVFAVIDCRKGHNQIAVEVESSVWRNLDPLMSLLEQNFNRLMHKNSFGVAVDITPETLAVDFVEHSRKLIKKKRIAVTKMTLYFSRGLINPKIEETIKNDKYLRNLDKSMFEAQHAEMTYTNPNGKKIIQRNNGLLEHVVTLIASAPNAFRMSISYENGTTYVCGKSIRMEFQMIDDLLFAMLGDGKFLFPEQEIGVWFDDVASEIKKQREC